VGRKDSPCPPITREVGSETLNLLEVTADERTGAGEGAETDSIEAIGKEDVDDEGEEGDEGGKAEPSGTENLGAECFGGVGLLVLNGTGELRRESSEASENWSSSAG